jgi:hypothetical protein
MNKNATTNQILLISMATVLLLLAAFSFYLLQDPSGPLPFARPIPSSTVTPLSPSPSYTSSPSSTSIPTRQTSYTPFASPATIIPETPLEVTGTYETAPTLPSGTISPGLPTVSSTIQPDTTITSPFTPMTATTTVSPTSSQTRMAGEYEVTGRVVQKGTPMANVVVKFADDAPPRNGTTNSGGHYTFITLAPGTSFTLTFNPVDNRQLTPVPEITSLSFIEGSLPTGVDIIDLPDLEVSLNIDGMNFGLQTPVNGATFSAAAISPSNPIQFIWTLYNEGDSYHIELGANGRDAPIWISSETAVTNWMWNGTLGDGSHISEGAYWWRVGVKKSLGNYYLIVFTQKSDLTFNP